MSLDAWLTILVVVGCMAMLVSGRLAPDLVLAGAAVLPTGLGILSPGDALAGFANEGLATIALLYVVAAGIRETGGTEVLLRWVLGRPRCCPVLVARRAIDTQVLLIPWVWPLQ